MSTLYAIKADLDALKDLLYEVGGDVTDADADAAITAWLHETDEALRSKLDRYAALIRELESSATSRKVESDRLASLATTDLNTVKRLKDRLQEFFEAEGMDRYETLRFKFTLAGNGGKAPVHVLVPPEALPEWARRVTVSPDVEAIRNRIDAGEAVDFAQLGERGKHLRVR